MASSTGLVNKGKDRLARIMTRKKKEPMMDDASQTNIRMTERNDFNRLMTDDASQSSGGITYEELLYRSDARRFQD